MEDENDCPQRSVVGPGVASHFRETLGWYFHFAAVNDCILFVSDAISLKRDFFFLSHKSRIQMLSTVPAFNTQLTFPSTNSKCDFNGYVKMEREKRNS